MIVNQENFEEALDLITEDECVVDTETEGLDVWNKHKQCGIGICNSRFETAYFPFRHKNNLEKMPMLNFFSDENEMNLPLEYLPRIFERLNRVKTIIGHNIKFDLVALLGDGFHLEESQKIEDTMALARLYFPGRFDRLNLETVSMKVLNLDEKWKSIFVQYLKKNKIDHNYDMGDPAIVGDYCEKDCLNTARVRIWMRDKISRMDMDELYLQESAVTLAYWEMEQVGLPFDSDYLESRIPLLKDKLIRIEADIHFLCKEHYEESGKKYTKFDILSNNQLDEVMMELGIESFTKTPTGQNQWDVTNLLRIEHPIAKMILDFRAMDKMLGTYFLPLREWKDGRVHPNIVSAGPITGRGACRNPNLQNLSRKKIFIEGEELNEEAMDAVRAMLGAKSGVENTDVVQGKAFSGLMGYSQSKEDDSETLSTSEVRRLYIPPEDYYFYTIDYSQMEMRVFADYVQDESLTALLESSDFDFHSHVAKEVWNTSEKSDLWKFYRVLAKQINFGLIYGIGDGKLATQIHKTIDEARIYKAEYFARFPKALGFMEKVKQTICSRGWVKNRFNRRYYIEAEKAYKGVNYLVQGTSADIVKNRIVACQNFIKKEKPLSKLVVPVHDEAIFFAHKSEHRQIIPYFKGIMEERCIQTFLPTSVARAKTSWADKKDICIECFEYLKEEKCNNDKCVSYKPESE
ncbi:MAG: hypothetical protein KG003_10015 [Bacteroidetes bacterium]|nr:hypothetical protein [Bacteroidota bacterium]